MEVILNWLDAIWIFVAIVVVSKAQRVLAVGFIIACMMMMRMQVELMEVIKYPYGLLGLWPWHVFNRGLLIYSIFYAGFFVLAHYSPNTKGALFIAGSISIFFMAFVSSMLLFLL